MYNIISVKWGNAFNSRVYSEWQMELKGMTQLCPTVAFDDLV